MGNGSDLGWLDGGVRDRLISEDVPFLERQLRIERIELLLINGSGVKGWFEHALRCSMERLPDSVTSETVTTRFFEGEAPGGARVVAWSTNLQSSFGVTSELRRMIADRVEKLCS